MPNIISVSSSSKLGLFDLPYAKLPQDLSHPKLQIKQSQLKNHPLYVISGLSTKDDILRGEETQLIGLHYLLSINTSSTVIIPGTHSKHMFCAEGVLTQFKTYMTGELFEIISKNSVLSHSVKSENLDKAEILNSVNKIMNKPEVFANALFQLRKNRLRCLKKYRIQLKYLD